MASPVTQRQVLKIIMQAIMDYYGGDPWAILEDLIPNYYVKVFRAGQVDLLKNHTSLSLLRKACNELPNRSHPYGKVSVRVRPLRGTLDIFLYRIAGSMHDYPFHPRNNVDVDAETDMLLTGPRENISYKYFHLCRMSIMYAPHLFEKDSPVILLALALQTTETVKYLLENSGVVLRGSLDDRAARLLENYQRKHGGTGWAEAFDGIRQTMKDRWHSTNIDDYKGCGSPDSYVRMAVSSTPSEGTQA